MKKGIYFLALSLFAASVKCQVDGFHIGGRFGIGESTIQSNNLINEQPKLAIIGGVASNYQFNKFVGINADFLLSSIGVKASGTTKDQTFFGNDVYYSYKERYDFVYAELPVTGQLSAWFGNFFVRAYAGPGMNFKLSANQTRQYDDINYNNNHGYIGKEMDQTNNITYSMIYGFGIGAAAKDNKLFFLDLRFNQAISSLGRINNNNAFNNYYCITAGYTF